jgi:AcrR family transcriptional regulator
MAKASSTEPIEEVKARRIRDNPRGQQVLEVASRMFLKQGYDATSIQEIADEVGVLKGSLYYYITGKEDLLFAIIDDVHRGGAELLGDAATSSGDTETRFRSFLDSYVRYSASILVKAAIFDLEFRALSMTMRRRILAQRQEFDNFLTGLITEGQQDGTFRRSVVPAVAANSIYLTINGLHRWYKPSQLSMSELSAQYCDLFVAALAV